MVDHILILTLYFNVAQATLYDIRDSKPYTVRKLADGNCWMTSNLVLALSTGTPSIGSYNDGTTFTWTPTNCGADGECAMNGNTGSGYYTWYAATAGVGKSSDTTTDINGSICPSGWKIPQNYSINQTKSYGSLTNSYNFSVDGEGSSTNYTSYIENFPLNFARAGMLLHGGTSYFVGSTAGYWSSTSNNESGYLNAFLLGYAASYMQPQSGNFRYTGFSLRCVAI